MWEDNMREAVDLGLKTVAVYSTVCCAVRCLRCVIPNRKRREVTGKMGANDGAEEIHIPVNTHKVTAVPDGELPTHMIHEKLRPGLAKIIRSHFLPKSPKKPTLPILRPTSRASPRGGKPLQRLRSSRWKRGSSVKKPSTPTTQSVVPGVSAVVPSTPAKEPAPAGTDAVRSPAEQLPESEYSTPGLSSQASPPEDPPHDSRTFKPGGIPPLDVEIAQLQSSPPAAAAPRRLARVMHQTRMDARTRQPQTYQVFIDIYGEKEGKANWDAAVELDTPRGSSLPSGRGSSTSRSRGGARGRGGAHLIRQKR